MPRPATPSPPTRLVRAPLAACVATLLLALVPVLVVAAASRAVTDDDGSVTWGVRTASSMGADRQNYTFTVEPGDRVVDAIVVTNHDSVPIDLDLYAADGFTTEAGQLDVAPSDVGSVGLGAWVELATDHVTLAPGESLQVDFAVTVPEDAEPGDHAGAVVTSLSVSERRDGVTVDRRLGIRIHLRVAGELTPAMAVEDLHVEHQGSLNPLAPGRAAVTYTVRNTGNTRLSADQDVTVSGPFGVAHVAAADLEPVPELLPGETWRVSTTVDDVWPLLRIGATVTLDPQLPEGVAGSAAAGSAAVEPLSVTAGAWAVPWSAVVLVAAAAGAALLARYRRTRRRQAEAARVQRAVEQALRERDERVERGEQGERDERDERDEQSTVEGARTTERAGAEA